MCSRHTRPLGSCFGGVARVWYKASLRSLSGGLSNKLSSGMASRACVFNQEASEDDVLKGASIFTNFMAPYILNISLGPTSQQ